ncbi:MAG: fimbrillin family protein [Alistipes sp.]|nr:fimbrillin family protein [Alistipes sp.]
MKKILISMLAVAALVSCSKEESIRVDQGEAIAFGNAFVDNSTRATDPSYSGTADFTSFQVWGTVKANDAATPVAIFEDDTVTATVGANSVWTCNVKQYWIKDALYNFAALANADAVALGDDKLPKTVTYTADQTDLVYAKSAQYTGKASGNELVAFTFQHLLSKVNFTVVNGSQDAEGYSFLVRDIEIAGATAGTCDVTTTPVTWTATANNGYTIADITVDNDTASADCGTALLVVPGAVTVSFNVDILVDGVVLGTKEYTSAATTLAPANSYNFVVTPTVGEEIKFTVANDLTWTDGGDINVQ